MVILSNDPAPFLLVRRLGFVLRDALLIYSPGRAELAYLFRKALDGDTVAENCLKHGTGGINVEGCRVSWGSEKPTQEEWNRLGAGGTGESTTAFLQHTAIRKYYAEGLIPVPTGRWPTNLVVIHAPGCVKLGDLTWSCQGECWIPEIDDQSGISTSNPNPRNNQVAGMFPVAPVAGLSTGYADKGGGSRFYPQFATREELLDWVEKLIAPSGSSALRCTEAA
jgi:hypothetical protein